MSSKGHPNWRQPDDDHPLLRIREDDTVKAKFRKVAIDSGYPDMPGSALKVAVRLHLNMSKTGVVDFQASERELARATKLDKKAASTGIKFLEAEGLLERTNIGRGRRGKFKAGIRLASLIDGQTAIDGYSPQALTALLSGAVDAKPNCPGKGGSTAPIMGAPCPENGGTYPSPLSSPYKTDCSRAQAGVDLTPTTEGSLPSSPIIPSPSKNLNSAPRPPVASATVKSRVAPATVDSRVASAPDEGSRSRCSWLASSPSDHYGHGTPIAGLDEYTDDIVDRVVAMQAGIITNKDPAWTTVLGAVRETSPRRVMAAILDLEATHAAGKLRSPVLRALRGFAAAISEEDAATKLEEAAKPKPRTSAAEMFGWRR